MTLQRDSLKVIGVEKGALVQRKWVMSGQTRWKLFFQIPLKNMQKLLGSGGNRFLCSPSLLFLWLKQSCPFWLFSNQGVNYRFYQALWVLFAHLLTCSAPHTHILALWMWRYSVKVFLELSETGINTTEWFPLKILTSDKKQVPLPLLTAILLYRIKLNHHKYMYVCALAIDRFFQRCQKTLGTWKTFETCEDFEVSWE